MSQERRDNQNSQSDAISFTLMPIAIVVFSLTSSPSLNDPPFISLTMITGTFLERAKLGRCFASHRGLQSAANNMAYKSSEIL